MTQLSIFQPSGKVAAAIAEMASSGHTERGAIFTRREVVDFILDLVGYTADKPLCRFRLLEPSFGHGDFLVAIVDRLLTSYEGKNPERDLAEAVRGFEIHRASIAETKERLVSVFAAHGHSRALVERLAEHWLVEADYLLSDIRPVFTHIVGNPPYVRQEMVAGILMSAYRSRFKTIYDRADLYVPFIEQSLQLLAPEGRLCFICSDRWMKNKYGGPLRELVSSAFHLSIYVDMVGTPAFNADVIAYPAITVITRDRNSVTTRVAHRPDINAKSLVKLARALQGEGKGTAEAFSIVRGAEPWLLDEETGRVALVRRLEKAFPTLEEAGCQVGIGVATGADKVFIAPFDELDVEDDRKLPLVTTKDIRSGMVNWQGLGVINPFAADGRLVPLAEYPRLRAYLEERSVSIRSRNVAKRVPDAWYRTIDRIYPGLAKRPKLLIPDIKGAAHIVLEEGRLYPHHNLYYVVSETWDLRALQAVLGSGIADLFVSAYSVKMAGGHLRFQAQYLRRIRLPRWEGISKAQRDALVAASARGEKDECCSIVFDIYGLSAEERSIMTRD